MQKITIQEGNRLEATGEAPITIDSSVFKEVRDEISEQMRDCLEELASGIFKSGVITAKISLSIDEDELKDGSGKYHTIPELSIEYKVNTAMKKTYSTKGDIKPDKEIIADEGGFYLADKSLGQTRLNV